MSYHSMPEDSGTVRIKVKSYESEAEVEASLSNIRQVIELIPELLAKLPQRSVEPNPASFRFPVDARAAHPQGPATVAAPPAATPSSIPTVTVEKGDSLSDVISRFFTDPWGRSPRKLMEVREALQSYGLNYPKQSVAVALLRLAKASRIRRFKGEGGEYVYTVATGAARVPTPVRREAEEESAPEPVPTEEPEEQLNLDAPSSN